MRWPNGQHPLVTGRRTLVDNVAIVAKSRGLDGWNSRRLSNWPKVTDRRIPFPHHRVTDGVGFFAAVPRIRTTRNDVGGGRSHLAQKQR